MHFGTLGRLLFVLTMTWIASIANANTFSVQTTDGMWLSGESWGTGDRGLVLVHGEQRARSAQDWAGFAEEIARKGFLVAAINLRGHGTSSFDDPTRELQPDDYQAMVQDVHATMKWLRDQGATEITLMGAELGATLVTHAAAADEQVVNLVLLTPGLNLQGMTIKKAFEDYGARPVFIGVGSGDTYYANSARFLEERATGANKVHVISHPRNGQYKGAKLLNRSEDLNIQVVAWLEGGYKELEDADEHRAVATGDTTNIETSGVKFGEEASP